ncbi:unnamed protein product [Schistocephalus solidus]|uniref:YTH domain-containing protein n=1 Tax=Schistocephalus solidus TaxID=70667 RepID=A0A183SAD1_SCHSO|nr:unnamed protein product [Schistocephalus solidus]
MHVMQSIRHGVWCSTPAGNDCLNKAFLSTHPQSFSDANTSYSAENSGDVIGYEGSSLTAAGGGGGANVSPVGGPGNAAVAAANMPQPPGRVILFFSVNSSGCFCGVAEMISPVNKLKHLNIWQDSRWRGAFDVRWIYAKVAAPSQLHLPQHGVDAEDSGPLQDFRFRDPNPEAESLPSQLRYSVEVAQM